MQRRAASPRAAAPLRVCALWTELLARLWLAAVGSSQAPALRQLHAMGLRRVGTASVIFLREQAVARRMAACAGAVVEPAELHRRIGVLAHAVGLACHVQGLAAVYRRLQLDPATPQSGPVALWLAGRLRVHEAQAEALGPAQAAVHQTRSGDPA